MKKREIIKLIENYDDGMQLPEIFSDYGINVLGDIVDSFSDDIVTDCDCNKLVNIFLLLLKYTKIRLPNKIAQDLLNQYMTENIYRKYNEDAMKEYLIKGNIPYMNAHMIQIMPDISKEGSVVVKSPFANFVECNEG
jgi:hypothetical protein